MAQRCQREPTGPFVFTSLAATSAVDVDQGSAARVALRFESTQRELEMPNETTPILQQMQRLIGSNTPSRASCENRDRTKEAECDSLGKTSVAGAKA